MAFEIGAIQGRLELDRTPFTEGLRLAREQADRFERNKIEAQVDVDTAKADAEIEATQTELDRLDHTTARPEVKVDTRESSRGIGLLGTAIIALGPAAIAAGGVAAGALAPVALGIAGVTAVALPALKNIHDAATKTGAAQQKALAALGPGGAAAVAMFQQLQGAWHSFQAQINPALFQLLGSTFHLIAATLPAFVPLFTATANALNQLVQGLIPLAPVFGQAFARMSPLITMFTNGLLHMAQALARWTQGQGFTNFIHYVVTVGPQLVHTLGAVAGLFVQIGVAAAPLLPILLQIITALAQFLTLILEIPGLGPALVAFVGIAAIAYKVGGALAWLGKVFGITALEGETAFGALGVAADALLANPLILAAAAIVGALAYIVTHWQQTVQFLESLWRGALDAYNATIGQIPGMHIGPDHPNKLQQFVNQQRAAQHGGGGDFSGPGSGSFGGSDFSGQDMQAGQLPVLPTPKLPTVKVPKIPKVVIPQMPRTSVPGSPRAIPIVKAPVVAVPIPSGGGGRGSSVPFAVVGSPQAMTEAGLPDTIGTSLKGFSNVDSVSRGLRDRARGCNTVNVTTHVHGEQDPQHLATRITAHIEKQLRKSAADKGLR